MLVSGRKNLLRPVSPYPSNPCNPIDLDVKQHAESSKPRASCQKWNEISGTPINVAENTVTGWSYITYQWNYGILQKTNWLVGFLKWVAKLSHL